MKNRAGLCVVWAIAGVVACGGASETNFGDPVAGSGTGGTSGGNGSGATVGGSEGGTGGSASSGTSGSATGGTGATDVGGSANGGSAGDVVATGGTAGDLAEGGMAGDLMAAGGTAGDAPATGGSAGDGMATGGTDPGAGGSVNAGGSAGTGSGGTAGKPGAGGSAGTPNCPELTQQYAETLHVARACNASSGKDQCTELVPGSLTCGCDVFVNAANEEAIAELQRLRKQGLRCMAICPAIACAAPEGGTCMQDPDGAKGQGSCVTALTGGPI